MAMTPRPVDYFQRSLNAFYYLGIFPFRFQLNESTNQYEIVQHSLQRIICIVNYSIGLLLHIFNVREVIDGMSKDGTSDDPLVYFKLANLVSGSLFLISVYISLWRKSKHFLVVFNQLQNLNISFERKRCRKVKYLSTLLLYPILLYPIVHIFNYYAQNNSDWSKIVDFARVSGMKILFLGEMSNEPFALSYLSTVIFVTIDSVFAMSFILLSTFGEILILNCVFCMGDIVDEFKKQIKHEESNFKVVEYYETLRKITISLNCAVGVSIFGEVFASLPYFVSNFVEFIHPPNASTFLLHFIEFGNIFGFICVAANVHRKATVIEEWILDHDCLAHLSVHEINIMLHNMSAQSISLSGAGFFQITSGFVGSFVSLLLTFSVILIQFKGRL